MTSSGMTDGAMSASLGSLDALKSTAEAQIAQAQMSGGADAANIKITDMTMSQFSLLAPPEVYNAFMQNLAQNAIQENQRASDRFIQKLKDEREGRE